MRIIRENDPDTPGEFEPPRRAHRCAGRERLATRAFRWMPAAVSGRSPGVGPMTRSRGRPGRLRDRPAGPGMRCARLQGAVVPTVGLGSMRIPARAAAHSRFYRYAKERSMASWQAHAAALAARWRVRRALGDMSDLARVRAVFDGSLPAPSRVRPA